MKRKGLITASALSLAFLAAATYQEWTGWKAFDRDDGVNFACAIDPACRHLTQNEIDLARGMFGDRIKYNRVKIYSRPYMGLFGHNYDAITPNGNIYIADPPERNDNFGRAGYLSAQRFFIHEMTHVAQHQRGMNLPELALKEFVRHAFNYRATYKYTLHSNQPYGEMNLEQQAEFMEDYFARRYEFVKSTTFPTESDFPLRTNPYGSAWLQEHCSALKAYEVKLSKYFPVISDGLCP